jgi:predicted DNA-binding transcriptional regulator YafY
MLKTRTDGERRQRQGERFARILRALRQIQAQGATAQEIAADAGCNVRTAQRDIDVMRRAGEPISLIGGKYVYKKA